MRGSGTRREFRRFCWTHGSGTRREFRRFGTGEDRKSLRLPLRALVAELAKSFVGIGMVRVGGTRREFRRNGNDAG